MAGVPKRRPGERQQSYRLRVVDAEYTRRDEKAIAQLMLVSQTIRLIHEATENWLHEELVRYYRAEPGTKYDASKKKGK